MPFFRRVRGIRASLPSGSVIGRKSGGIGAAEIISPGDIVRAGSVTAPAAPGPPGLISVADDTLISNVSGGSAVPSANTVNAVFDHHFGTVDGTYSVKRLTGAWSVVAAATGSGTVTSVGMTVPAELSVSGSPITTSGTLAVTWANENDNTILSRIAGSSGVPSFNTVNAILDHALGSTNDKFAIRRSGSWTQDNIASLLTAGVGINFSGTTNLTISGAYVAGSGISISGATITNTGASGSPGGAQDWIAPIYGGGPPSIMRAFGEQSVDGGAGTGPAGSGPVGSITIQWQTPKQKANFVIWDGARYANSNLISSNAAYPNAAKYSPVGSSSGEVLLELCAADGTPSRFVMNAFDNTGTNSAFPTLNVRYARGTAWAPTATQSGDVLGTLMGAGGYAATDFSANVVRFRAVALENFTATANGCKWNIQATAAGASSAIDCANIAAAGCWFLGTNTNNNAAAGQVGEIVEADAAQASVSLTTGAIANFCSISLTAGDWDVSANAGIRPATGAPTDFKAWISTTSAANPGSPNSGAFISFAGVTMAVNPLIASVGMIRLSLATTTTVYLSGFANFPNTCTAEGHLRARRAR